MTGTYDGPPTVRSEAAAKNRPADRAAARSPPLATPAASPSAPAEEGAAGAGRGAPAPRADRPGPVERRHPHRATPAARRSGRNSTPSSTRSANAASRGPRFTARRSAPACGPARVRGGAEDGAGGQGARPALPGHRHRVRDEAPRPRHDRGGCGPSMRPDLDNAGPQMPCLASWQPLQPRGGVRAETREPRFSVPACCSVPVGRGVGWTVLSVMRVCGKSRYGFQ